MVWGGVLLMSFVVLGTSGTLGAVEEGPDEECSSHTQPESEAPETANHSAPIPVEVRPAPVSSREADAEPQGCPVQPEPEELPSGEEWEEEQGDRSAEVFLELSQRHPPPSGLFQALRGDGVAGAGAGGRGSSSSFSLLAGRRRLPEAPSDSSPHLGPSGQWP